MYIYYVNNNQIKETILPIIKKMFVLIIIILLIIKIFMQIFLQLEFFLIACFQVYQVNDFNNLGYILYRVNHNVWWGKGHFHTNSIEGTWSKLKRLTSSFNGVN